jgi:hypothetical protein
LNLRRDFPETINDKVQQFINAKKKLRSGSVKTIFSKISPQRLSLVENLNLNGVSHHYLNITMIAKDVSLLFPNLVKLSK